MSTRDNKRVLSIDPTLRGFGFVVFEGPDRLIDWAVTELKDNNEASHLTRFTDLIDRYRPDVLASEDTCAASRRCQRVRELLEKIRELADKKGVATRRFSRKAVKRFFAQFDAKTKYQIALAIAKRFPELAPRLPRFRKPWMTEDERMNLFDAASFGLTFFYRGRE